MTPQANSTDRVNSIESHIPASTPPFILVDDVPNFRELGGYRSSTDPKKSLRRHLLYRCAQLNHIKPDGEQVITSSLNIHHLFDLRSEPETKPRSSGESTNPTPTIEGLERHFTPVYRDEDLSPGAMALKYQMYRAVDEPEGYSKGIMQAYRDICLAAGPSYAEIIRHILETKGEEPLIVHCTAGKDRTGVFAALMMRLVGVDDETIAWEYNLTEKGLGKWTDIVRKRLMEGGPGAGIGNVQTHGMSREQADRVLGAKVANMRHFLTDVLDEEFGGAEQYLRTKCKLSSGEVDQLRGILAVEDDPEAFDIKELKALKR